MAVTPTLPLLICHAFIYRYRIVGMVFSPDLIRLCKCSAYNYYTNYTSVIWPLAVIVSTVSIVPVSSKRVPGIHRPHSLLPLCPMRGHPVSAGQYNTGDITGTTPRIRDASSLSVLLATRGLRWAIRQTHGQLYTVNGRPFDDYRGGGGRNHGWT